MLELKGRGHEVSTPPYFEAPVRHDGIAPRVFELGYVIDKVRAGWFDLLVFHNVAEPVYLELARLARRAGSATVADRDDSDRHPEWHPAYVSSHEDPFRNQDWRRRLFQSVDCVTVSTEALVEEWAPRNRNVRVLPNFLHWPMWEGVEPQYDVVRERSRLGWMGVSKWRMGDLDVLKPAVRVFLDEHPGWDFVAAGDPGVHDVLGVPDGRRVSFDQVAFPRGLAEITASMDVGLVPLARRDPVEVHFNDCKSCLKGMEYAACGVPCVASPSRPYREGWFADGRGGRLADGPGEWLRALRELAADEGLRRRLGREAREKARTQSISDHAYLWEELYCELVERAKRRAGGRSLSRRVARAA
jgi:glycosyltransferase involved in cell wall biosynthesis